MKIVKKPTVLDTLQVDELKLLLTLKDSSGFSYLKKLLLDHRDKEIVPRLLQRKPYDGMNFNDIDFIDIGRDRGDLDRINFILDLFETIQKALDNKRP